MCEDWYWERNSFPFEVKTGMVGNCFRIKIGLLNSDGPFLVLVGHRCFASSENGREWALTGYKFG